MSLNKLLITAMVCFPNSWSWKGRDKRRQNIKSNRYCTKISKTPKNFPSFCWKSDKICQRKKSLINVHAAQHPHYYMHVDIEWPTYSHECDPMHFYTIHAYHCQESDSRYKSVSKQAQIVTLSSKGCKIKWNSWVAKSIIRKWLFTWII